MCRWFCSNIHNGIKSPKKKMRRDLTALCIVKQSLNRPTRALIIKVRSFCQRPNVTLCLKETLLQSPFQCQIIFFILIHIFAAYWTLLLSQRFCLSAVHKIIYFVSACSWLIRLQIFFSFSDKQVQASWGWDFIYISLSTLSSFLPDLWGPTNHPPWLEKQLFHFQS